MFVKVNISEVMHLKRRLALSIVIAGIFFGFNVWFLKPAYALPGCNCESMGDPALSAFCVAYCGFFKAGQEAGLPEAGKPDLKPQERIAVIVGKVINPILGLVGVVFVVLTIVGGLMWMLSGGNEERIKKSTKLLFAAIVGLILTVGSYVIANFVMNTLGVFR